MKFEALQARHGDCLLLTFDGMDRPGRLLVDGGPATVFENALKPRLETERLTQPGEPLILDAVMVSHIDADHIVGVLDLFESVHDATQRRAPVPYRPRWLLHNSFDAIAGEGEGGTARNVGGETVLANFGTAGLQLPDGAAPDEDALKVLASYRQGSELSNIAAMLSVVRNPPDQQVLMLDAATSPRVLRIGQARLRIIGPLGTEVDALRRKWAEWRAKVQKKEADAEAAKVLAAYLDRSVPNLSSIVAMVEFGPSRILLTGDARGDKVLTGLEQAGLLGPAPGNMFVDILKLPHHGSDRNVNADFFERIHAAHYVASGDGTYGNPSRGTIEMLEAARPNGGYTVHLTYPAEEIDLNYESWLRSRSKPFDPAVDGIGDIVARWRLGGPVQVKEGPVEIVL